MLCASARLTDQNIAISKIAREAILRDPAFHGGDYAAHGTVPADGLSIARMLGHVTYLSDAGMSEKFGRRRRTGETSACAARTSRSRPTSTTRPRSSSSASTRTPTSTSRA